jgi:hypothetical protein
MDASRCEPAGSWHAFDGRRPPYTRPDQGPTGRTIHDLSGADAQHRVHTSLDEEGEMGRGTQAPIGHQYITGWSARMDRLHPGKIMGQEGRNDQLQEHTRARMEQSQEPGDGAAAPRPLRRRLAAGGLQGRRIWHGASRALDQNRAMAMPPSFVQGGSLHRAAEVLQEEVQEAPRESGAGLTVCRRTAPQARQMGQMAAGGVAMEKLSQAERHRGNRREHAIAPGGIPDLTAQGKDRFGLQQRGPRTGEAWQHGRDIRNHRMTSCTIRMFIPIHTGDAWRLPASARAQVIHHAFCLT